MISIDLSGKAILITGALGAIAEHIVRKLVASGATLVLTDIKGEEPARRMLDDWQIPPSSYLYFAADITESIQVDRVLTAAFERFPGMDTVLGHAGGCGLHPFAAPRKPTMSASSASTILRRLTWREQCSRNGCNERLPVTLSSHLLM